MEITCRKCQQIKDSSLFSKSKKSPTGFQWWCKSCVSISNKRTKACPEFLARRREQERNHARTNPIWKMVAIHRTRVNTILKGNKKSAHSTDYFGCSREELKTHIEKQWKPGMNWDNHGLFGWHIDHIKPCASFPNLHTSEEERKQCFHYTNFQPLWAKENLSKSDKWEPTDLPTELANCAVG